MMQLHCAACQPAPLADATPDAGIKSGLTLIGGLLFLAGILTVANWSMKRRDSRR